MEFAPDGAAGTFGYPAVSVAAGRVEDEVLAGGLSCAALEAVLAALESMLSTGS